MSPDKIAAVELILDVDRGLPESYLDEVKSTVLRGLQGLTDELVLIHDLKVSSIGIRLKGDVAWPPEPTP